MVTRFVSLSFAAEQVAFTRVVRPSVYICKCILMNGSEPATMGLTLGLGALYQINHTCGW